MSAITLHIPDDLAERLRGREEQLGKILELGLRDQRDGGLRRNFGRAYELHALHHPHFERWADHFELRDGEMIALTSAGRVTVKLLRLYRADRVKDRAAMVASGWLWMR